MLKEDKLIRDNIKKLRLVEYVDRNKVMDAIQNHNVAYIYYKGDDTVNAGYRTIEPYVLGVSTAGNLVLRAWQQAGASDSNKEKKRPEDKLPGWRLFRLDGITSFLQLKKKFIKEEGGVTRPDYNPNDKGMTDIFAAVDPDRGGLYQLKGVGDVTEPNVTMKKISAFDPQTEKFKMFFNDPENKRDLFKKFVTDIYELIQTQYKKNPKNYIITKTGEDEYGYDLAKNAGNYEKDQVVGNLSDLFTQAQRENVTGKINRNFFRRQREDFIKKLQGL